MAKDRPRNIAYALSRKMQYFYNPCISSLSCLNRCVVKYVNPVGVLVLPDDPLGFLAVH